MSNSDQVSFRALFIDSFKFLWTAAFLFQVFRYSTENPPSFRMLMLTAGIGIAFGLTWESTLFKQLLFRHCWIFTSAALLGVGIFFAERWSLRFYHSSEPVFLARQPGLLFCLAPLAFCLVSPKIQRLMIGVMAGFCVWHFFAMPVEAIFGKKITWHMISLFPRHSGIFNFQASGLALQCYYYPGLFMPLFYLAAGPIHEKRVFPGWLKFPWMIQVFAILWLWPTLCVQSRSTFVASLLATSVLLVDIRKLNKQVLAIIPVMLFIAVFIFIFMFSTNKSGFDQRWVYMKHYFMKSMEWPNILTGHGFVWDRNVMQLPGFLPLAHSHNDLTEFLYRWGWLVFSCYLVFWYNILRFIFKEFFKKGEFWPVCGILALLPSMMTDLGFQHYEKAACIVLLVALCMAFSMTDFHTRELVSRYPSEI